MPRRWLRALPIIVPLLLLLGTLAGLAQELWRMPSSLARARLAGAPMVTGPICIEEAVDVSGSLVAYASQRDEAETEMFSFARRQLPRNDLLSEAFFAATGKLALAPARLSSLSAPPAQPPGISPDATYLTPAVEDLIAARRDEENYFTAARQLQEACADELKDYAACLIAIHLKDPAVTDGMTRPDRYPPKVPATPGPHTAQS